MKVFVGIMVALVGVVTSAAPVEDGDTCVRTINDLTKDIDYPEPINRLVSKLETVLDIQRVVELAMATNNTAGLVYAVSVARVPECDAIQEKFDEIMPLVQCIEEADWSEDEYKNNMQSGGFGKFMRSAYSCMMTKEIENPDNDGDDDDDEE